MKNITRHLENSRRKLQANWYSLFQREKENLGLRQILQDTLLEECYFKNKKENEN